MWFWNNKKCNPVKDPTSIGNIMVRLGFLSSNELKAYVKEFKETTEKRIGEFLVEREVITEEQLESALIRQQLLRGDREALRIIMQRTTVRHERIGNVIDELDIMAKSFAINNGGHNGE